MRNKILLAFIVLIVFLMTAYTIIINGRLNQSIESEYAVHFVYELDLLELLLREDTEHLNNINEYVDELSLSRDIRVTIISEEGVVLADSDYLIERMDNHLLRPEIVKANKIGSTGLEIRRSSTMREEFIYVAKKVMIDQNIYYIRLSEPIREVRKLSKYNIFTGFQLAIYASLIAGVIAWVMSARITKPINELTRSTMLLAAGEYDSKIIVKSNDEVKELADSFNLMLDNLHVTMDSYTTKNAELTAILNSMASGIIAIDKSMRILLINKQCYDILNLADAKLKVNDSVYKAVKSQEIIDMVRSVQETGEFKECEIHHVHTDKILRIRVHPIVTDAAQFIGIILSFDDITQIRRLENMRTEFVSNVTHELKTPLTSILGFVETLQNGAVENSLMAKRFLTIIETETVRLSRLINDILTLSEIESSDSKLETTSVNIGDVIKEALDMLRINIGDKDLMLLSEVDNTIMYECNRDRIKQLIINLVDNAIKYTESGFVKVYLNKENNAIKLVVEDTGIGFTQEEKERLFERFYRIDKARSRNLGGTGLGLSIVKHIVNLYGGEVAIESEKKQGAKFIVMLPRQQKKS